MSFKEDLREFLDVEQGFAIYAMIKPSEGLPYKITGILASDYYPIDAGEAGFAGERINFECMEEDIEEVEYGDLLTINRRNYKIVTIKPDGTGWVVLELERQE